jgi:hypothetical protein
VVTNFVGLAILAEFFTNHGVEHVRNASGLKMIALTHYVKVKTPGKKAIYLECAKFVTAGEQVAIYPPPTGGMTFLTGYQVNKEGDAILCKGGGIMHLIQVGPGVKIWPQETSKMYGWFENTGNPITFEEIA